MSAIRSASHSRGNDVAGRGTGRGQGVYLGVL